MCAVRELDTTSESSYMVCLIGHTEFRKRKKKKLLERWAFCRHDKATIKIMGYSGIPLFLLRFVVCTLCLKNFRSCVVL